MSKKIEIDTNALDSDKNSMSEELQQIQKNLEELQQEMETMKGWFIGPAAAAYQSRMSEEIENAMSVCTYLTEYISCVEEATKAYIECEQAVERSVKQIWV